MTNERGRALGPGRAWVVGVAVAPLLLGGLGVGGVVEVTAQSPLVAGGFTAEQAASGWTEYGRQCAECHGPRLDGMAHAPPLRGVALFVLVLLLGAAR